MITGIVDGTAIGGTTLATMQGGGNLVVNNATGSFIVSSGTKSSGSTTDTSTLNLSGLASFTATVNRFDVGRATNAVGVFQGTSIIGARPSATLTLASTNTITANTFVIGANNQATTTNTVNLGQENVINTNTLVLGNARTNGTLQFNTGLINPTLVLRGVTGGNSRTNVFVGDSRNSSGVGGTGGSSQPNGIINLTGGTVDLRLDTLSIGLGGTDSGGTAPNFGLGQGTFTFDGANSIVDVNTLIVGRAINSNAVSPTLTTPYISSRGTFNIHEGTLQVNTALTLAQSDDGELGRPQITQGTFNLEDGRVLVGTSTISANIVLGDHTSTGTGMSTAVLNLNGGSLSVFGDILRGNGLTEGTINLNGTSMNMNGSNIGEALKTVTLNLQSGSLANVGEINGGGTIAKTGNGTLALSGTNNFTGATLVSAGRLLVTSAAALQSTSGLTVESMGTFAFMTGTGGSLTLPALTLNNGATLALEDGSSTGSLIINPAAIVSTTAGAQINIQLYPVSGQTAPASSLLISAPAGGLTSNGATYTLGTVYNATNYTIALQATDTQLSAITSSATELAIAYWLGGFTADDDAWAASNGSNQSNWVTNSNGTGATGLVPGAGTNVFFSATGATLPATTVLGAEMQINSLTVTTASPLTLSAAEHRLIIHGNSAITVASGAGAISLDAMITLEGSTPVMTVDNAGGLLLTGEISGTGGLTKAGTGTLILGASVNLYQGRTSILSGTLAISTEAALGNTAENLVADYLLLNGGTLRAIESLEISDTKRGITLGSSGGTFEVDAGKELRIDSSITGTTLTKTGAGRLELTAVNTYTGITYINTGTLALSGSNNRLPASAQLNFGGSSSLDLGTTSQTVARLEFTAGPAPSLINFTGNGGMLIHTNTTSLTNFTTSIQTSPLTVDMSGLSTFTHQGGTQILRIGLIGGGHSATPTMTIATVTLAQNSTLTAGQFLMGDQVGSSGGGLSILYLGQNTTLNLSSMSVASSRSSAAIAFAEGLVDPTVKIRGNNGTAALGTWNMGAINNFTNNVWTSTADFSGGSLDALVTTLNVGRASGRAGTIDATFIMEKGQLTVTNMNIGQTAGGDDINTETQVITARIRGANSVFELNGPGTVTVTNLMLAENTATSTLGSTSVNGTLLIRDGTFNVGAGGINMVTTTNMGIHSASGTLDLRGGTLNVNGNIFKTTTGTGTTTATLFLNGGTLNMNGNSIGTAARPVDIITLQSGVLENVSQINGGAPIIKSGSSTDILRLNGTITHTGTTTLTGGILLVNGTHTGGGTYTVQNGTTLGGNGMLQQASGAFINITAGATLSVGDGLLTGQTLQLVTSDLGQLSLADNTSVLTLDLLSDPGTGGTDHTADATAADRLVVQGQISLNGARLVIADPNGLGSTFTNDDTWRIFDWSGITTSGFGTGGNTFTIDPLIDLPALSGGHFWDLTDLYVGGTISVVPEPGRAMLLFMALGACLLRRRRVRGA